MLHSLDDTRQRESLWPSFITEALLIVVVNIANVIITVELTLIVSESNRNQGVKENVTGKHGMGTRFRRAVNSQYDVISAPSNNTLDIVTELQY